MAGVSDEGPVLRFEGVHRSFRAGGEVVRAMDGVDLEVATRGIVTLVGPSGCGKTTLIRLAAGLDHPASGGVWRQ